METYASYTIKDLGMGDIQVTGSSELTQKHLHNMYQYYLGYIWEGASFMERDALIITNSRLVDWAYDYFTDFDESTLIGDDCADANCPCNQ